MRLFVGLGNPGSKFAQNRHNIGFMVLDRIAADHGFGPWRRAFKGQLSEGRFGVERVLLLKPETFMNLSGEAVQAAMVFHKITPDQLTVFHDELDLEPAKCRVKHGGGHAGHNGLRSIHAHIGADYGRVRLGIGHPGHKDAVANYVLHDFAKADADWLAALLVGLSDGAPSLASGDSEKFMTCVARQTHPPRSGTGVGGSEGKRAKDAPCPRPAAASPTAKLEVAPAQTALQVLLQKFRS